MDIIQSFTMVKKVVDSLHLNIKVYKEGRVTTAPLFGEESPIELKVIEEEPNAPVSSYKLLLKRESFQLIGGPGGPTTHNYGDTITTTYGKLIFNRNYKVKIDPKGYRITFFNKEAEAKTLKGGVYLAQTHDMGGIVEISMNDAIPERGVVILNTLIKIYDNAGLDDKNIVGLRTIKFLNDRIDTVNKKLDNVEIQTKQIKKAKKN